MTTQTISQDKSLDRLRGHLNFFDFALIGLDRGHANQELLGQMHRGMQTVQAVSRQACLSDIESIACDLVEMLESFRSGLVTPTKVHVQLLRRCLDSLEDGLDAAQLDLPAPTTLDDAKYELRLAMAHEALTTGSTSIREPSVLMIP